MYIGYYILYTIKYVTELDTNKSRTIWPVTVYCRIHPKYITKTPNCDLWTHILFFERWLIMTKMYVYKQIINVFVYEYAYVLRVGMWFMLLNATFNKINTSVIPVSWRSVLLVEESGVHGENHRPIASHWQTLSHNVVLSREFENMMDTQGNKILSCSATLSMLSSHGYTYVLRIVVSLRIWWTYKETK
jgi:hypothetical protein